jgi:hypothetical protein
VPVPNATSPHDVPVPNATSPHSAPSSAEPRNLDRGGGVARAYDQQSGDPDQLPKRRAINEVEQAEGWEPKRIPEVGKVRCGGRWLASYWHPF